MSTVRRLGMVAVVMTLMSDVLCNSGREFFLGFLQNRIIVDYPVARIYVTTTSGRPVTVTVRMPALTSDLGWRDSWLYRDVILKVVAGSEAVHELPSGIHMDGSGIEDKGVVVTATDAISVQAASINDMSSDAYQVIPADKLGTDHVALSYVFDKPSFFSQGPSQIGLVSTADGTAVNVTLPVNSTRISLRGYDVEQNGDLLRLVLNKYQTFQLQSLDDLTGTRIESTHPVAVLSGSKWTSVSRQYNGDHVIEQMPPVSAWGRHFLAPPIATRRTGDVFRVLASTDNTEIRISFLGGPYPLATLTSLLDKSRSADFDSPPDVTFHVSSSQPVLVAQFCKSYAADQNKRSDPFMTVVPPMENYETSYTFATADTLRREEDFEHYVNIITIKDAQTDFLLDDKELKSADFFKSWYPIPDTEFVAATLKVAAGGHALRQYRGERFGGIVYGLKSQEAYGYPLGLIADTIWSAVSTIWDPTTQLPTTLAPTTTSEERTTTSMSSTMTTRSPEGTINASSVELDIGENSTSNLMAVTKVVTGYEVTLPNESTLEKDVTSFEAASSVGGVTVPHTPTKGGDFDTDSSMTKMSTGDSEKPETTQPTSDWATVDTNPSSNMTTEISTEAITTITTQASQTTEPTTTTYLPSTQEWLTTVPETTTLDATTPPLTTTVEDVQTTSPPETTLEPTTVPETTTYAETTLEVTTTLDHTTPVDTTVIPTTLAPTTTVNPTTEPATTTSEPGTTEGFTTVILTTEPTTTYLPPTTRAEATTQARLTTLAEETTVQLTTTLPTTVPATTTLLSTAVPTTTVELSTIEQTTTAETTTVQEVTTTSETATTPPTRIPTTSKDETVPISMYTRPAIRHKTTSAKTTLESHATHRTALVDPVTDDAISTEDMNSATPDPSNVTGLITKGKTESPSTNPRERTSNPSSSDSKTSKQTVRIATLPWTTPNDANATSFPFVTGKSAAVEEEEELYHLRPEFVAIPVCIIFGLPLICVFGFLCCGWRRSYRRRKVARAQDSPWFCCMFCCPRQAAGGKVAPSMRYKPFDFHKYHPRYRRSRSSSQQTESSLIYIDSSVLGLPSTSSSSQDTMSPRREGDGYGAGNGNTILPSNHLETLHAPSTSTGSPNPQHHQPHQRHHRHHNHKAEVHASKGHRGAKKNVYGVESHRGQCRTLTEPGRRAGDKDGPRSSQASNVNKPKHRRFRSRRISSVNTHCSSGVAACSSSTTNTRSDHHREYYGVHKDIDEWIRKHIRPVSKRTSHFQFDAKTLEEAKRSHSRPSSRTRPPDAPAKAQHCARPESAATYERTNTSHDCNKCGGYIGSAAWEETETDESMRAHRNNTSPNRQQSKHKRTYVSQ